MGRFCPVPIHDCRMLPRPALWNLLVRSASAPGLLSIATSCCSSTAPTPAPLPWPRTPPTAPPIWSSRLIVVPSVSQVGGRVYACASSLLIGGRRHCAVGTEESVEDSLSIRLDVLAGDLADERHGLGAGAARGILGILNPRRVPADLRVLRGQRIPGCMPGTARRVGQDQRTTRQITNKIDIADRHDDLLPATQECERIRRSIELE